MGGPQGRVENGLQSARQFRPADTQLSEAVAHQPAKHLFSPLCNVYMNLAPVSFGPLAAKQSPLFHSIDEFDSAVVLDLQPFSEAAESRLLAIR